MTVHPRLSGPRIWWQGTLTTGWGAIGPYSTRRMIWKIGKHDLLMETALWLAQPGRAQTQYLTMRQEELPKREWEGPMTIWVHALVACPPAQSEIDPFTQQPWTDRWHIGAIDAMPFLRAHREHPVYIAIGDVRPVVLPGRELLWDSEAAE